MQNDCRSPDTQDFSRVTLFSLLRQIQPADHMPNVLLLVVPFRANSWLKVEHEKMKSRQWQHTFGANQYTEEGKISEFARRQVSTPHHVDVEESQMSTNPDWTSVFKCRQCCRMCCKMSSQLCHSQCRHTI